MPVIRGCQQPRSAAADSGIPTGGMAPAERAAYSRPGLYVLDGGLSADDGRGFRAQIRV